MDIQRRIGATAVALASVLGLLGAVGTAPALAGTATHFSVSAPSSATAGNSFSFTVTALDSLNNVATTYGGHVHFTTSDGNFSLPVDSTLTGGVGTFSATLRTAGSQTITATDTLNSSITGRSNSIFVFAAAATHFDVSAPSSATAGTAFDVTVTALDQFNNTATSYNGNVHFTSSDGQAVLPADQPLSNGTGSFSATLKTAGSQTITGSDTVTPSISGTSDTAVSAASATHFAVSAPASATAGAAFAFTVVALDQFDNVATGYRGHVHFTSSDGQASLPTDSTLSNGTATFSATLKTTGSQTITATDTASSLITGTTNSVAVSAAAATHFFLTTPASATAGTAFFITVTAEDRFGNQASTYAGTVHFTSSDGQATLHADSGLTNGFGIFSTTLKTAGIETITATDTVHSTITGTSSAISVAPAAATHFVVSTPAQAAVGQAFSFTVTALDQFNNTATGYAGHVHITSTDPVAALPANATLSSGVGTLRATLNTLGSRTIKATDTVSSSITGTSATVTVGPPPTHFSISGPSTATAGGVISLVVTARDSANAVVPGYTGTVHFATSDSQGIVPADTPLVNGTGTFSATLKTAGSQTITATDTSSPSLAASLPVTVGPAATTRYVISAPSSTTAGVPFQFTVSAQDAFGNATPAYGGTAHFSSSDGQAIVPADTPLVNGTGTFSATLETAGSQTVTATDLASPSVTGTSKVVAVAAAAASRLVVEARSSATAGSAFSVTVTALDKFGNTATGYGGTIRFTSTDRLATLPGSSPLTHGVGSFSVTLRSAGTRTITAADAGSPSLTGTTNPISVRGKFLPAFLLRRGSKTTLGKANTFVVPGASVRCPVGAPRGCLASGSATAAASGNAKLARRRVPLVLATGSLTLAGGRKSKIVMHLTPAGAARLRSGGSIRLTAKLSASVVGGSGTSVTRVFTLTRVHPGHRR